ncbi:HAMP domain-containing histidine kinase [Thalassomonas actiniarum]|uniref:HAMP domain-containing histidine kinase n=1 Tax=Thalassomonas actiniarum TaxID=485447 RepID=A0AAE9YN55_9GAMM|nr:HAMP domain-containing histidine kinase [Thalassomonas actiniarum]WDD97218.1 HAMP domain-containing histidine kinase [Thalassomonas actiniarum]
MAYYRRQYGYSPLSVTAWTNSRAPTGDISIVVRESDGYLTLDYKDNGKGADQAIIPYIFDPLVTTKCLEGEQGAF